MAMQGQIVLASGTAATNDVVDDVKVAGVHDLHNNRTRPLQLVQICRIVRVVFAYAKA